MRYFSEDQVRKLANPKEVIHALREAFTRDSSATLRMPVRTQIDLGNGSVLLLMPAYDTALQAAGIKTVTVTPQSGVLATYQLLDPNSGAMLALMEANYLTELRTAAASALATDLLSRSDAKTLGVFGSGKQAAAHIDVLRHVRNFRRFLVCGSGRSDLNAFRARMKTEHGIELEIVDADFCSRESDVLCTCTTSSIPLFDGRLLRPGAHLNLVGAFQPHTREVDDETVRRSRVVVDTYDGCLAEAGDLLIPLKNNVITRKHIIADLHEISSGKRRGRATNNDITLFKSVGCALEDLVTALLVFNRAETSGTIVHS